MPLMKKIFLVLAILFAFSCDKEKADESIKQETGTVWLSGGLAVCAEQIHLDNDVTLIVKLEDIISFKSGDRVTVKYKESGINESCPPGINCEIVHIVKARL